MTLTHKEEDAEMADEIEKLQTEKKVDALTYRMLTDEIVRLREQLATKNAPFQEENSKLKLEVQRLNHVLDSVRVKIALHMKKVHKQKQTEDLL